jgi:predicted nuclease of predicted toxin-antitoxin system
MDILADENLPRVVVEALRAAGHDVVWVREQFPGATDNDVMNYAQIQGRVLMTFDKDFGNLAFRSVERDLPGVILFRTAMHAPNEAAALACSALSSRNDWVGHFSVVESDRVRMTPLPRRPRQS